MGVVARSSVAFGRITTSATPSQGAFPGLSIESALSGIAPVALRIEMELVHEVVAYDRRARARLQILPVARALLRVAFDHHDAGSDVLQVGRYRGVDPGLARIGQPLTLWVIRFRLEQPIGAPPDADRSTIAPLREGTLPVVRR